MRLAARISADKVAAQRWRNGGGWTRQLLAWPPDTDAWQLRISVATITAPGAFSAFPGVRRALALVSGDGLLLTVEGAVHRLSVASDPLYFDGAAAAHAQPLGGDSIDLNLMVSAGHGELLRAVGAAPWLSACPQRGLYSAVAGTLHAGADAPLHVPAHTLFWYCEAAGLPLAFAPEAVAAPESVAAPDRGAAPVWWLGYAPPG